MNDVNFLLGQLAEQSQQDAINEVYDLYVDIMCAGYYAQMYAEQSYNADAIAYSL